VRDVRYFTLEYGLSPIDGERFDVVCEWTLASHVNYGITLPVDELAFIETVRTIDEAGTEAEHNSVLQLPADDHRNLASPGGSVRDGGDEQ
jgi:hypothetical protein